VLLYFSYLLGTFKKYYKYKKCRKKVTYVNRNKDEGFKVAVSQETAQIKYNPVFLSFMEVFVNQIRNNMHTRFI
jgi:hypothetical protein